MAKRDGNIKNLKPLGDSERTKEEQRKIQVAGGIASGKARRKKKGLLECARTVLEADIPEKQYKSIEKMVGGLEEEENTLFTASVAVMMNKALSGDVKAFNAIKDIVAQIEDQQFAREIIDDPLTKALEELGEQL